MSRKIPTLEEIRANIRPDSEPTSQFHSMPERYIVTLSVTDEQFGLLKALIEKEHLRITNELRKPLYSIKRRQLECRLDDWEEIKNSLSENVW